MCKQSVSRTVLIYSESCKISKHNACVVFLILLTLSSQIETRKRQTNNNKKTRRRKINKERRRRRRTIEKIQLKQQQKIEK